ncbi:hypothetical protein A0O28_0032060 [Trichoderma guizhouense]|uniref:RRM domain-containing protein n=1 Tax=Trichoderma guizhouense TaxID=1491466 RepID=A0A1T3CLX9_9HYPO|nr:hypothetical protein A0O28_0032060 [Trichoderma guizhouense]
MVTNPSTRMASHNAQFENQIGGYARNRRCLVASNINFRATRAQFEASVRARLTNGDSVTFFWPPSSNVRFINNKKRHQGLVYLGFETRADARVAEQDLQNYVFSGRAINVFRATRYASSELAQATAAPAATTSTTAIATRLPPPPPPPTATAITAATTTAPPAPTNRNPSDSTEEPRTSWW